MLGDVYSMYIHEILFFKRKNRHWQNKYDSVQMFDKSFKKCFVAYFNLFFDHKHVKNSDTPDRVMKTHT